MCLLWLVCSQMYRSSCVCLDLFVFVCICIQIRPRLYYIIYIYISCALVVSLHFLSSFVCLLLHVAHSLSSLICFCLFCFICLSSIVRARFSQFVVLFHFVCGFCFLSSIWSSFISESLFVYLLLSVAHSLSSQVLSHVLLLCLHLPACSRPPVGFQLENVLTKTYKTSSLWTTSACETLLRNTSLPVRTVFTAMRLQERYVPPLTLYCTKSQEQNLDSVHSRTPIQRPGS